ncbi:hypothetical protein GCM10022243_48490 [Saccharothrix violaceirubra]|uniref:Uncharacterized protein n=1 Tax=Saccharothrix violaceirubra TaxID=413306 RepID=A0A7W7SZK6_9PSEU|nr:hypothetical protein [Saccharothrix violaceirubra]MBB4963809.1 hypothetical protein [Saccharothrix violaceirubra]
MAAAVVSLVLAVAALVVVQRNWLTLADTERILGDNARTLASVTGDRETWMASAVRHYARARAFERRAWPFRPKRRGVRESDPSTEEA